MMRTAVRRAPALALVAGSLAVASTGGAQTGSLRVSFSSPTAASLGKFGDVPVNLYSGVPDISVPMFTVKGRTLELPIVLRYHAGGIRVQEIGGWAGLGWSLDAGGTITRTVRGLVDESANGYYNTGQTLWSSGNWPNPPTSVVNSIANEQIDGEPDRFFFSFAGRSGQFVMGPTSTSAGVIDYRTVPAQKLAIQPVFSGASIVSWVITTEDGTRYTFGAAETNTDFNLTSPSTVMPAHYGDSYTSSWHLTGIHAVGGDSISLYYGSYTARHRTASYRERFTQVVGGGSQPCVPSLFAVTNEYQIAAMRLDSIKGAAHTIRFSADPVLRQDARSPTGAAQEPRLAQITVSTPTGTVRPDSRLLARRETVTQAALRERSERCFSTANQLHVWRSHASTAHVVRHGSLGLLQWRGYEHDVPSVRRHAKWKRRPWC